MHWLVVLLTVASIYGAWHWWSTEREVSHPRGMIIAADAPRQESVDAPRTFVHDG